MGTATSWNPAGDGSARTVVVSGTKTYLGGTFTTIGGDLHGAACMVDTVTGTPPP